MKLLAEGAEASIYAKGNKVIKQRHSKGYRIKQLDDKLRLFRTKREAKILERLKKAGLAVPQVIYTKATTINMELIKGKKLRDVLTSSNCESVGKTIGKNVAVLHDNDVIHGDLTTSNMIKGKNLYFIDFGLGFFSEKTEDKAVDLHLLKQALKSSHSKIAGKCFTAVVKGYKTYKRSDEVLKRLELVESRGRYKGKKKA